MPDNNPKNSVGGGWHLTHSIIQQIYSYSANSGKTFDVGKNSAGSSYTAFLKIASLTWKANDNTTLNFGMVGTKNFKFMEKIKMVFQI